MDKNHQRNVKIHDNTMLECNKNVLANQEMSESKQN